MAHDLLDDPQFLAELDKLDVLRPAERDGNHRQTIEQWVRAQGQSRPVPAPEAPREREVPRQLTPAPRVRTITAEAPLQRTARTDRRAQADRRRPRHPALAFRALKIASLISAGAGAAALVFHDTLLRILSGL